MFGWGTNRKIETRRERAGVGANHGEDVKRPLTIASQDHGSESQQFLRFTVTKDDFLNAGRDRDRKNREEKRRQHLALAVVAMASPVI